MTSIDNAGRYKQAVGCLCPQIYKMLIPLADRLSDSIQEIRLRINRPLAIVCSDVTYYVTANGGLTSTPLRDSMLNITRLDINDTFHNICNYSVYTRQNEIINGYVTMHGGHRVGICGTAVVNEGSITNIRDITSINIRISREYKGCAEKLYKEIDFVNSGVLICGAPCSGKTTVLRDLARLLSIEAGKNVSLIDERGELAGVSLGVFQNDIGMCDVFDSYKKSEAMIQAIRSMAPDIIICDEIGANDDVNAIEHSINSGVSIIATIHAANESELKQKENIRKIAATGGFSKIVFLSSRNSPGQILRVADIGDVFGN